MLTRKFGSRDYSHLCKNVLNNGKSTIPPLFNEPEVLTSPADKAECFAQKFTYNSALNTSGEHRPDFPLRAEILLSEMCITPSLFLDIISKLHPH